MATELSVVTKVQYCVQSKHCVRCQVINNEPEEAELIQCVLVSSQSDKSL